MATYNNIKKIKIGDNIFNLYDSGNSGGTVTGVKINGTTKTPSSGVVDIGTVLTSHQTAVTSLTTSAGAHTTKSSATGAVSIAIPTKTSHLTNDSGFTTAFWATYGTTTSAEIEAAYQAGKDIFVKYDNHIFRFAKRTSATYHEFTSTFLNLPLPTIRSIYVNNSAWNGTIHSLLETDSTWYVSTQTTTDQSISSSLLMPEGKILYLSTTSSTKPRLYADASTTYHDCIYYKTGNNSDTSNHYHAFYAAETGIFYITPSSVYTANSATFTSAGKLTVSSGGAAITGAVTTTSSLETGASITTGGSFVSAAHCRPNNNTTTTNNYLGTSDYRWNKIYAKTATIDTSDAKEKDVLGPIDYAKDFIMNLNPIQYQWKESGHKRIHMGFVAQEVARVGKTLDKNLSVYEANYKAPDDITDEDYNVDNYKYNGEEVDDNLLTWGLSYSELIAPTIKVVQEQQKEIEYLKEQNIKLQTQIEILMKIIS